jgi:hypothetical protein
MFLNDLNDTIILLILFMLVRHMTRSSDATLGQSSRSSPLPSDEKAFHAVDAKRQIKRT